MWGGTNCISVAILEAGYDIQDHFIYSFLEIFSI